MWGMPLGELCVGSSIFRIYNWATGEMFDCEKLSKVCAETGRYTFFFSSWPLNMWVTYLVDLGLYWTFTKTRWLRKPSECRGTFTAVLCAPNQCLSLLPGVLLRRAFFKKLHSSPLNKIITAIRICPICNPFESTAKTRKTTRQSISITQRLLAEPPILSDSRSIPPSLDSYKESLLRLEAMSRGLCIVE